MASPSHQVLAQRVIDQRAAGGPSYRRYVRTAYRSYAILIAATILIFAYTYLVNVPQLDFVQWLVLGLTLGAFLRDHLWIRLLKSNWPFSESVTDWAKVEAMAAPTSQVP